MLQAERVSDSHARHLRKRREDIPILVEYFVKRFAERWRGGDTFRLMRPGRVRRTYGPK